MFAKKLVAIATAFSLFLNSLYVPLYALAQETDPEPTPIATEEPVVTSEPTAEETVTPTEIASPTPEVTVEPTPTVEESTPTPEASQPENQEATNESAQSQAPPSESSEPSPTVTPVQPEVGEIATTVLGEVDFSEVTNLDGSNLTTDKADYSPTDTVVISATGLTPNKTYQLLITSVNNYSFTDSVTADADGSFVYLFTLDGTYRPDYLVEVNDGSQVVAVVAFTDTPVSGCTNDSAGANDEPGQKDLTRMCVNYSGLPTSEAVTWNWDETGWSGSNTGDACALFDTDGDGLANYASCVTVEDDPAVQASDSPRIYSCNDTKADRCAGDSLIAGPYTSSCGVSISSDQPFAAGADTPNDTQASCTIQMSEVGGAGVAALVDVCSYPSEQPNSDPSDCVLFKDNTGRLEVVKDLVPSGDSGLFNLQIDSVTQATDVGNGGTTGEKVVTAGSHTVGEVAGTGTSLSSYSSAIVCKDLSGTGATVASGTNSGPLSVTVAEGDDIVCTITNTLQDGTIVVHKDVQGPVGENIVDTSQNFTVQLDGASSQDITDGGQVTYNDVVAGAHTITESVIPAGYVLYSMTSDGQITVVAGETTHVYIVNRIEIDPELGTLKTRTSDATALEGETVTFEIEVENTGNVTLYNVVVSDIYDYDYLQYISSSPIAEASQSAPVADASDYDGDGDTTELVSTLTWEIGDLAPGATYTLTLTFEAIQFTDDTPVTTYTGNEAWAESCLEDTVECGEENTITTETSPAVVDIDALGEVSGYKFVDADGEGDWDTEEGTLAGVTVNLYDDGDNLLASTVTAGDGSYSFINLATGDYKVCESVPTGYAQTFPSGDGCHVFSITDNGEDIENKDFGNRGSLSIFGYKYDDENGDGVDDSDWTPVEGLLINLWKWVIDQFVDTGETDTTDVNGYYEFLNLEPGTYQVSEYLTSLGGGWTNVTQTTSDDIVLTSENTQHDFVNTQYGSIRVVKQTLPDGSQENFEFSASYHNENFLLTDGFSDLSGDLLPGTYSVSELPEAGWDQTSATCDDGSDPSSISLQSGEVVVCTFTNTQRSHIVIQKNAILDSDQEFTFNNNFGNGNPATFGLTDDSTPGLAAYDAEVLPGTYSVSEDPVSGWQQESAVCDQGETIGSIDVAPGETVTCTFTNEELATIILVKNTVGGDETFDFDATGAGLPADIDLTTVSGTASQTFSDLDQDNTYTISENVPAGWDLTSATCDQGETPDDIDIGAGETVTCTFTNTQLGNVTVVKYNDHNGNGIQDEGDEVLDGWEIWLNDMAQWTGAQQTGQVTFSDLLPGEYTLSEQLQDGWVQTGNSCGRQINLAAGQDVTCYIGNQGQGTITVNKNLDTDGVDGADVFGYTDMYWELDSADHAMGSTVEVAAGSYGISEIQLSNYHFTSLVCKDRDVGNQNTTVAVAPGEDVVCTYTNTRDAGTIIVEKQIEPDSESTFNFTIEGSLIETIGFVLGDGDSTDPNYTNLPTGTYTVNEEANDLYSTTAECVSSDEDEESIESLQLDAGETITCTFTNTRKTGSLTIHKIIDADGNLETTDDQTDGEGWYFGFEGTSSDTSSLPTDSTNSDGLLEFEGVKTGTYNVQEVLQPGYDLLSNSCADGFEVSENQTTECTFINTPNGSIHGIKWNDLNGNGIRDCIFSLDLIDFQFGCEPVLSGWTIFIDENENSQLDEGEESTQTDGDGWYWFTYLFPGTYRVCEVQQGGWNQTYPENCHIVEIPQEFSEEEGLQNAVFAPPHNFGNQAEILGVTIEKSNDKSGGASAGNTVTYTLVVTNTGNQTIYGLDVTDSLPGGFTYITGTTTGDTTTDPTVAGNSLTWENVTNLAGGSSFSINYQVQIASDVTPGTYTNLATCSGNVRSQESQIDCNVDDSSVPVGQGRGYGGNLTPQVLGISTVLPATGSATGLLLLALTALGLGVITKKYAKK